MMSIDVLEPWVIVSFGYLKKFESLTAYVSSIQFHLNRKVNNTYSQLYNTPYHESG